MLDLLIAEAPAPAPIHMVSTQDWDSRKQRLPRAMQAYAEATGFSGQAGRHLVLPDSRGRVAGVLLGIEPTQARHRDPFGPGRLSGVLPAGDYVLKGPLPDPQGAALSWLLSAYRFERYKNASLP